MKWMESYTQEQLDRYAKQHKNQRRKKIYGISTDDFEIMFKQQNGRCAICLEKETNTLFGRIRDLAIDHNHKTNQVRALLCARCNRVLGKVKEDTTLLRKMITYLEKWDG